MTSFALSRSAFVDTAARTSPASISRDRYGTTDGVPWRTGLMAHRASIRQHRHRLLPKKISAELRPCRSANGSTQFLSRHRTDSQLVVQERRQRLNPGVTGTNTIGIRPPALDGFFRARSHSMVRCRSSESDVSMVTSHPGHRQQLRHGPRCLCFRRRTLMSRQQRNGLSRSDQLPSRRRYTSPNWRDVQKTWTARLPGVVEDHVDLARRYDKRIGFRVMLEPRFA